MKATVSSAGDAMDTSRFSNIIRPREFPSKTYLLMWVDSNIDPNNPDCQNTLRELRSVINNIIICTKPERCIQYLHDLDNEKAFLISSGSLGQHLVPVIHDMSQIDVIYIFCGNKERNEEWAKNWAKIKGIHTDIKPICQALQLAVDQCNSNYVPISIIGRNEGGCRENFSHLDPIFIYSLIVKQILLDMKPREQSNKVLAEFFRQFYMENPNELDIISEFEHTYNSQSAIWWYTRECFLHHMLNHVFRTMGGKTIVKMAPFMCDIHRQIEELHKKQVNRRRAESFVVFHGRRLSIGDFEELQQKKYGLISFNSFLCAHKNRDLCLEFARDSSTRTGLIGILFQISIDPSVSSTPYAFTQEVSYFKRGEEILFSIHTVFQISDIQKLDNDKPLYQVDLKFTSDDDLHLRNLTDHIRNEMQESTGWYQLGQLMLKVGHFEQAEELYNELLNNSPSDSDRAHIYQQLSTTKDRHGLYKEEIVSSERSLEIEPLNLSKINPPLTTNYNTKEKPIMCLDSIDPFKNKDLPHQSNKIDEKASETQQITDSSNHQELETHQTPKDFLLILLMTKMDQSHEYLRSCVTDLSSNFYAVHAFGDTDECVDFLSDVQTEEIILIVSEQLAENLVPMIHQISQLISVFVLSSNEFRDQQWTNNWSKVKGRFTDINLLSVSITRFIRQYEEGNTSFSFITVDDMCNRNLNHLPPSFMYTQLFKEIIFEMEHNEQSLTDFVSYCHEICEERKFDPNNITKFEKEYRSHTPIWWYTSPYFISSILNQALRELDTRTIIKMGFFISDLHRQITDLYKSQIQQLPSTSLTLYRGQGLSKEDFAKLQSNRGGLISFNSFISTSKNPETSLTFGESSSSADNKLGVLFRMSINPSISSAPYANIQAFSKFSAEEEIIFSMHAVFRINDITKIKKSPLIYQVELELTSDDDAQLRQLTNHIRQEIDTCPGWHRLGQLLLKVGHFNQAEDNYTQLLNKSTDENTADAIYDALAVTKIHLGQYQEAASIYEKYLEIRSKSAKTSDSSIAGIYNNIASVYHYMGNYSKALEFYEKSLEIRKIALPSNHPDLAASYNNIALVYDNMANYPKALGFFERTLEIRKIALPLNHPDLAASYNNIARVYYNMGNYSKAVEFFERSLEIMKIALPSNHPQLAASYNNIALVYDNMGNYSKALEFYEKSLKIMKTTLPSNHPHLADSYNNIGLVYYNMGNYSKALEFYEKSLEIRKIALPLNHPDLAASYNNIALVYDNMGNYSKALEFYEKSLEIRKIALPSNHPHLATSYNNIASVYYNMGNYSKALEIYEKSLEIRRIALPSNHPSMADSYNNIALMYRNMGNYSKALEFYEKSVEITKIALPSNHPHLATSYNNIASVYYNMGNYSKALEIYEKSLEIRRIALPSNHPSMADSYNNIALVYRNMGNYSTALEFYEKSLEITEIALPSNHPNLTASYNNIASVYYNMGNYPKTLEFFEKSVEIMKIIMPSNHPDLATSYSNIASVYGKMGNYSKALGFFEKSLEIRKTALPSNHPHLAASYNSIALVYRNMGNYAKALEFYKKSLEIKTECLVF